MRMVNSRNCASAAGRCALLGADGLLIAQFLQLLTGGNAFGFGHGCTCFVTPRNVGASWQLAIDAIRVQARASGLSPRVRASAQQRYRRSQQKSNVKFFHLQVFSQITAFGNEKSQAALAFCHWHSQRHTHQAEASQYPALKGLLMRKASGLTSTSLSVGIGSAPSSPCTAWPSPARATAKE